MAQRPKSSLGRPLLRILDHTHTHIHTRGRTPLNERSARRSSRYLHNRTNTTAGFEIVIPAIKWFHTYATGIAWGACYVSGSLQTLFYSACSRRCTKCFKRPANTDHLRNPKLHELVLRSSRCNNDYLSGILRVFKKRMVQVFWNVMLCQFLTIFEGLLCPQVLVRSVQSPFFLDCFTLKMRALQSFETSVIIYQSTGHRVTVGFNFCNTIVSGSKCKRSPKRRRQWTCIRIPFNNQTDALIIQIYSVIKLYMFRASSLSIIQAESGWNILTLLGSGHQNPHETYQCRMYGREPLMMGREDARNM